MAHNFKLTGTYYVSVDGSDSNSGLTKDAPKRTIQAGLNLLTTTGAILVIGAGHYYESISRSSPASTSYTIQPDGQVIIDGILSSSSVFSLSSNGGDGWTLTNLILQNFSSITFGNGIKSLSNCKLINSTLGGVPTLSWSFFNCLFINMNLGHSTGTNNISYNKCCLINSIQTTGLHNTAFLNSYVNSTSLLNISSTASAANFNYNNIQGSIIMNTATGVTTGVYQDVYGRYYNLTLASGGDGTVSNPYGRAETSGKAFSYTNHRILYPTFNANSISLDPKFNKIEAQDFTLQADSPHIGRASDGISNIGGTNYAIRDAANGDVFYTSAVSRTNLAFLGNDQIVSGGTSGEVIGAPRFVSNIPKVLQKIGYVGLLEFNKSATGGTTGNKNVPDQEVYDSTTQPPNVAGANPDRLVYYMRFSTQVAQPATSSEWDNGGLWTAGNYETFEWNTKPSVDNVGVGNGSPSFNVAATPVYLNATWIQMKAKLRNDYV